MVEDGTGYTPPAVIGLADELEEATGHRPVIVQLDMGLWRIEMDNGRVRMTVDYRRTPSRKIRWLRSALEVDGQQRPIVEGVTRFAEIFCNPPDGLPPVPEGQMEPMPPARDVSEAPGVVAETYHQLVAAVRRQPGSQGARVSLGFAYGRWTVRFFDESRQFEVRVRFVRSPRDRRWIEEPGRGMQILVEGVDRTAETQGNIGKAMSLLYGGTAAPEGAPGGTGQAQGPRDAARSNAVQTRQTVVRRV